MMKIYIHIHQGCLAMRMNLVLLNVAEWYA